MDIGSFAMKYLLLIGNVVLVICGLVTTAFGAIMLPLTSDIKNDTLHAVLLAVLGVGCFMLLTSCMGCCGAVSKNLCFLLTNVGINLILFLCTLVLIICFYNRREQFLKGIEKEVDEAWKERNEFPYSMNDLQIKWECCGKNGPSDYESGNLPVSCCEHTDCTIENAKNRKGCSEAETEFWKMMSLPILVPCFLAAAIELTASIFAVCLSYKIRKTRLERQDPLRITYTK